MIKQGDCLELMKEIPSGSVDMILTDLPFGNTDCSWDKRLPFEPLWKEFYRVCKPNAAICLFAVGKFLIELAASNLKHYRYKIVWSKPVPAGFLNANKMPLRTHEDILLFYRSLPTYNPQMQRGKPYKNKRSEKTPPSKCYNKSFFCDSINETGERYPYDVLSFGNQHTLWGRSTTNHPTQKPVALLEYLIKTYTNEGELVLDATMGSGSTGVACVNTGRRFIGFELEKQFYDIAEKRISEAVAKREQSLF